MTVQSSFWSINYCFVIQFGPFRQKSNCVIKYLQKSLFLFSSSLSLTHCTFTPLLHNFFPELFHYSSLNTTQIQRNNTTQICFCTTQHKSHLRRTWKQLRRDPKWVPALFKSKVENDEGLKRKFQSFTSDPNLSLSTSISLLECHGKLSFRQMGRWIRWKVFSFLFE